MHVRVVAVNHGTTPYADLLLRSLIAHHPDRSGISILLLDNQSEGLEVLDWATAHGVDIRQSGYGLKAAVTTHGEILRDAVLANPDCDAYLFVDSDVCFVSDNTIQAMYDELSADQRLFALQAQWIGHDGSIYNPHDDPLPEQKTRVRESLRMAGQSTWGDPYEFDTSYGRGVHPFCTMVRNDASFRRTVELVGLSPVQTQCERGAMWFDTLGMFTQVMKAHDRVWKISSFGSVIHFASASWDPEREASNRSRRDALLEKYAVPGEP